MSTNYSIDDGNGTQLTAGLQEFNVWRVAKRMANERGESVFVYLDPCPEGEDATEVEPEGTT